MQVTKSVFPFLPRASIAVALFAGGLLNSSVWADDGKALMDGSVRITAADVTADAQRVPEPLRSQLLVDPKKVEQVVSNLYVRRALADQAQTQGLQKQSDVAAALQLARDKVLSDAWLQQMQVKHKLPDQLAEAQARNVYNANPARFEHLDQVHVRHILIAGAEPESQAKAEELLAQLKKGADFAELAKENSADKGSGAKGGDLGFFEPGRMVPEFDKVAFALKTPGELSEPVKTQFGYHILRLEERRPAGVKPYSEVREQLLTEVRNKAVQTAIDAEVEKLQGKGKIDAEAIRAYSAGVSKR
ncbi:putative parvulin-type peptidyl-prolyl cis-trans isomerase|uniref:peptidylprolyl isomerase n=1 Tax=Delftia acidovorans TaxID=80866 RepID=UPI001C0E4BDD|nr:peptidylprolyl isomerase [Delftia acidovorans]MCA1068076.1 putative parvulin-type peptidyl-prolyl cis-trans isomerase [Delftia acidovorans]